MGDIIDFCNDIIDYTKKYIINNENSDYTDIRDVKLGPTTEKGTQLKYYLNNTPDYKVVYAEELFKGLKHHSLPFLAECVNAKFKNQNKYKFNPQNLIVDLDWINNLQFEDENSVLCEVKNIPLYAKLYSFTYNNKETPFPYKVERKRVEFPDSISIDDLFELALDNSYVNAQVSIVQHVINEDVTLYEFDNVNNLVSYFYLILTDYYDELAMSEEKIVDYYYIIPVDKYYAVVIGANNDNVGDVKSYILDTFKVDRDATVFQYTLFEKKMNLVDFDTGFRGWED